MWYYVKIKIKKQKKCFFFETKKKQAKKTFFFFKHASFFLFTSLGLKVKSNLKWFLNFGNLVIHMASFVRSMIKMALKSLFFCSKIAQRLGDPPARPINIHLIFSIYVRLWHAWVASVCSARGLNQVVFGKKIYFWFISSLSKILVERLVAFTAVDRFFKRFLAMEETS